MKTYILFIFLVAGLVSAHADEACHALRYDSYFVAQNLKDNLKNLNPEVSHPNFADHYLLLRADLAMETLYLIASCETGDFYHEKLSVDLAVFNAKSPHVETHNKNGTSSNYEWDGKSWIQGETTEGLGPVSKKVTDQTASAPLKIEAINGPKVTDPAKPKNLSESYLALLAAYPAIEKVDTCAKLDFNSFFRAQSEKANLIKTGVDLTHPNFAGDKLLIKTETFFEPVYLIADCKTGKFSDELLKGTTDFSRDSRLAIVKPSSGHPELNIWSETQWIRIPDPVRSQKDRVKNTLFGSKATLLANSLPNPDRKDVIRFENLKRNDSNGALLNELGVDSILSGKCNLPHDHSPNCEVETQ